MMSKAYFAFNRKILSDVELPLSAWDSQHPNQECEGSVERTVWVRRGTVVPEKWDYCMESISYSVKESSIVIDVPGVALFSLRDNTEVRYTLYDTADTLKLSDCFVQIILQFITSTSSAFLLHGSAVSLPDQTGGIIILGPKGSGKSTLAAALALSGCKLLCDDIIPISNHGEVLPGITKSRLLPDAVKKLDIEELTENKQERSGKLLVELPSSKFPVSCRVCIYLQTSAWSGNSELPAINTITGSGKFMKLLHQVVRVDGILSHEKIFSDMITVMHDIQMISVTYPADFKNPVLLAKRILHNFSEKQVIKDDLA